MTLPAAKVTSFLSVTWSGGEFVIVTQSMAKRMLHTDDTEKGYNLDALLNPSPSSFSKSVPGGGTDDKRD